MILALDLATTTGVAFGPPCAPPRTWHFRVEGQTHNKAASFIRAINGMMKSQKPEIVVIEAPFVGRLPDVTRVLMGMRYVTYGIAAMHGVEAEERDIAAIRKHFLGHSGGKRADAKAAVLARCRALGWPVTTEDEADAAALWSMVASEVSPDHGKWTMEIGDAR